MHKILPEYIRDRYPELKNKIQKRLNEFSLVPESEYFYEFCFCILTPQSKAKNAQKVIDHLKQLNFRERPFNPVNILRMGENYIRFHNTKAKRLLEASDCFDELFLKLKSKLNPQEKRMWIVENIKGMGMKEASHFMRNIGYRGLAILDRHILKHLVLCEITGEISNVSSIKKYLETEELFHSFSKSVNISVDELDLLFWSYETGEILK